MDKQWLAWFCGLVDGEGCFLLNCLKKGRTIAPHFRLGMTESEMPILVEIREVSGCGNIYIDNFVGKTNGRPKAVFTVTNLPDIALRIIPAIDSYGLRTNKRLDYAIWKTFSERWYSDRMNKNPHDMQWGLSMVNELRALRSVGKGSSSRKPVEYLGESARAGDRVSWRWSGAINAGTVIALWEPGDMPDIDMGVLEHSRYREHLGHHVSYTTAIVEKEQWELPRERYSFVALSRLRKVDASS